MRSFGNTKRSHTAYTRPESLGSAVREFLSLKTCGFASSIRVTGSVHVAPPSSDLLTSTAFRRLRVSLNERLRNHMSPFGEMSLHGSVARSQSEFVPLWSGSWQFEIAGWSERGGTTQLRPPLCEKATSSPLEPPDEKRSCCQVPMSESDPPRGIVTHPGLDLGVHEEGPGLRRTVAAARVGVGTQTVDKGRGGGLSASNGKPRESNAKDDRCATHRLPPSRRLVRSGYSLLGWSRSREVPSIPLGTAAPSGSRQAGAAPFAQRETHAVAAPGVRVGRAASVIPQRRPASAMREE